MTLPTRSVRTSRFTLADAAASSRGAPSPLSTIAFISDLHSNMEAIDAVLRDIESQGIERIICLGDVIGYGPEPRAALLRAMSFELTLLGNHEAAVLYYAEDFNEKARIALEWTRDQLNSTAAPKDENYRLWGFLGDLPESHRFDNVLLVHGSPRDPVREYMLPRDANDKAKMRDVFERMGADLCLVGHSHVPGAYPESGGFFPPGEVKDGVRVERGTRVIVNIGSVGQPRDGDNRASYVTFDGDTVRFRRVPYDFSTTMQKIVATGVLPRYLADRLRVGK